MNIDNYSSRLGLLDECPTACDLLKSSLGLQGKWLGSTLERTSDVASSLASGRF